MQMILRHFCSHLVDDFVQDDCIEAGPTWLFLRFCCAVFGFKHPTKMGPVIIVVSVIVIIIVFVIVITPSSSSIISRALWKLLNIIRSERPL